MRARGAILFVGLFVSFAWFYQAGGWNQNSRLDLVRAIVERGTLSIDAYRRNTGDYAKKDGHYYSDKAPGLALAAVPVAAVVKPALAPVGSPGYVTGLSYAVTLALAALPTALAALLLFLVACRLGAGTGGAALAAVCFGLATPAWTYATLFFGHALATGLLVAAFAAAVALGEAGARSTRRDLALALGLGAAAGWATITEYPSAVPAAILTGFALAQVWPDGWARRARVAGAVAAGAAIAIGFLVSYNQAAFGAPLATGYAHLEGFAGMKEGVMGVTYPKAHVLGEILFGRFRGLFFHAPVLLAGVLGFGLALATAPRGPVRRAYAIALAIVVYYVLFNAAYRYWNGGWSYGPRHLAPALPFLCLGLAPLWTRARAALRAPIAALALLSAGMTLVAVSTTAQPPEVIRRPMSALLWPAFADGDLSLNHQSFDEAGADPRRLRGGQLAHDAWNLGEVMGLRGHASLVPLALVWALCAGAWIVLSRRSAAPPRSR